MTCRCISVMNGLLAEHNTQLVTTLLGNPPRVVICTSKVDDRVRGRPKAVLANFCPFCGEACVKPAYVEPTEVRA